METRERTYVRFMNEHKCVKEWLERKPLNTQQGYSLSLKAFCEFSNVTPKEFQDMKRKKARDLAWAFIKQFINPNDEETYRPATARVHLYALKSFYRYKDGETFPLDSKRGGKHYFNGNRRKKAKDEIIPDKDQMWSIIDMTTSLRDRAMILFLFESGVRVGAMCNMNYGHIKGKLDKDVITLKIDDSLDTKLRGYDVPYYKTHIGKEAIEALKKYCDVEHKNSDDETPLFLTLTGKRFSSSNAWHNIKRCIRRANLPSKGIWTHSIRKAFRKVQRKSEADYEWQERSFGHKLPGSSNAYFDEHDDEYFVEQYRKLDFSRHGRDVGLEEVNKEVKRLKGERETLNNVITQQSVEIQQLKEQVDKTKDVGKYTDFLIGQMKEMQKQLNELTGQKRKIPDFVQPEQ